MTRTLYTTPQFKPEAFPFTSAETVDANVVTIEGVDATDALEAAAAAGSPTPLTSQEVRDAMKLAPTAGDAAAGSIDLQLATINAYVDCLPNKPIDFDASADSNVAFLRTIAIGSSSEDQLPVGAIKVGCNGGLAVLSTGSAPSYASSVQGDTAAALVSWGKTDFKLASDGLDSIAVDEPTAKPTTFRGWIMWLVQWFRRSSKTPTEITVMTEAGDAITVSPVTDDGAGTESLGPPE